MKRLAAIIAKLPRALWRSTLDVSIPLPGGLTTRIIEQPGVVLSDEALESLVEKLRVVARKTLDEGALTYGVFSGDRAIFSSAIITLICDSTGKPIAFNALALMDVAFEGETFYVTHLGLVMVDQDARNRGLPAALYGLTTLLLFARGGLRPLWISNVTQVPAVIGMVSETFSNVYPAPHADARQSFSHLALARQIMQRHRARFGVGEAAVFDEKNSVIQNAYTGGSDDLKKTFEQAQKHRNPRYNSFCETTLDYARGDDVLQLARMDLAAARRYLARSVPHGSLPALLAAAAFVALQRMVLPIAYWFDDTKRFGLLRPFRKPKKSSRHGQSV